jgi:hypothetical protein
VVRFRFELEERVEWVGGAARIDGHAEILWAIGPAPTRDASRGCLRLRGIAPDPLAALHPVNINVLI